MNRTVRGAGDQPLLRLDAVEKCYRSGDSVVHALGGVSLDIWAGEFVAIMGQSGSGKSTLMNMLGCLDRPTRGDYFISGKNVAGFAGDALAALRRQTFGFIFQRYNLLATASAAENVEIPATYAGMAKPQRQQRARELLTSLGLGERTANRPGQLSGGQQQRVAIARALMNNPPVILADEPTGALDSRSGAEVMTLLKQLHGEGRTIILITHDAHVAAHAARQIVISDGKIVSDSAPGGSAPAQVLATDSTEEDVALPEVGEATKMALRSLRVNLFRTVLTLLGIIIGVASVVTMLAVGNGSKQNTLDQIASIGTDLLTVRPGAPGIRSTGDIATLVTADATAVAELPNVAAVLAERSGRYTARYGNTDYATSVQGTGADFSAVRNWALNSGTFFSDKDARSYAPVAVLGQTVATNLFGAGVEPVGKFILLKNVPFEVIGVLAAKGAGMGGQDQDDMVVVPISTALVRLFGKTYVNNLTVKVADEATMDNTEEAIRQLLIARHRTEDFSIRNMASFLEMASTIQSTLTILLATVAAISLLVGGIGVMNIMLVSVTERTREIGVRMATGARARDILLQFLTEAAAVCTLGGVLGVTLGVVIGLVLMLFGVKVLFTAAPALLAFGCAVATGLVFGLLPARRAARLDPVVALASE